MTVPTFNEAVKLAKCHLEQNRFQGPHDIWTPKGHSLWMGELVGIRMTRKLLGDLSGPFGEESRERIWTKTVSEWVRQSSTSIFHFDALRFGVADKIEKGASLHPLMTKWLTDYLKGVVVPPKSRSGRGEADGLHHLITRAVDNLKELGMSATRNDVSPSTSACDAVAKALSELGLSPTTFEGVKRIWNNWLRERLTVNFLN